MKDLSQLFGLKRFVEKQGTPKVPGMEGFKAPSGTGTPGEGVAQPGETRHWKAGDFTKGRDGKWRPARKGESGTPFHQMHREDRESAVDSAKAWLGDDHDKTKTMVEEHGHHAKREKEEAKKAEQARSEWEAGADARRKEREERLSREGEKWADQRHEERKKRSEGKGAPPTSEMMRHARKGQETDVVPEGAGEYGNRERIMPGYRAVESYANKALDLLHRSGKLSDEDRKVYEQDLWRLQRFAETAKRMGFREAEEWHGMSGKRWDDDANGLVGNLAAHLEDVAGGKS